VSHPLENAFVAPPCRTARIACELKEVNMTTDWQPIRTAPRSTILRLRSDNQPDAGEYTGGIFCDREDRSVSYWMRPDGKQAVASPTHWRPL
jgi:hypothetical protein